jgi:hypothetical protein
MKRHCSDVNHISPPSRFDADLLPTLNLEDIPRNGEKHQESLWKISVLIVMPGEEGPLQVGEATRRRTELIWPFSRRLYFQFKAVESPIPIEQIFIFDQAGLGVGGWKSKANINRLSLDHLHHGRMH